MKRFLIPSPLGVLSSYVCRKAILRRAGVAVFLAAALAQSVPAAEEHLFEVTPPEKVAFNYPPPPTVGQADYFTIAENGQPHCAIVYTPRSLVAAHLLKAYLELSTGATFPLVPNGKPTPAGLATIQVGDTTAATQVALDLPDVKYGESTVGNVNGYVVKTVDPQTLVIRGASDRAHVCGVVGFLKRYVGVRHYWAGNPGDIGDVVPHHTTLRIPELQWRDWPYLLSRQISGLNMGGPAQSGPYAKTSSLDYYRLNYTIPSNESYYQWVRADQFGETHPEFFPVFQGKRFIPKMDSKGKTADAGWQPCVSNPELPKIVADELIAYFDKHPEAIAINLAVNDGNGDCECEQCRAMDAPHADMANRIGLCDRYIKFNNKVCEYVSQKYPHKIIAFIAYGSTRLPPTTVKLHPMLMPVVTILHQYFTQWDSWLKQGASHMGVYLYHDDQSFFVMPKVDVHQSAKRIRYGVASGRLRHFYQEMYALWPIDAMVPYVENELLWDPRLDVDQMLAEYYHDFFGPAAEPMKKFYDTLEAGYERWKEQEGEPHWFGKDLPALLEGRKQSHYKALLPEEVAVAEQALQQATQLVQPGSPEAQRLDAVTKVFGFIAIGARQYALTQTLGSAAVKSEADASAIMGQAHEVLNLSKAEATYKKDVMQQPPASIYGSFMTGPGESRVDYFKDIEVGRVNPSVTLAISHAFASINTYFAKNSQGTEAEAWWNQVKDAEKEPLLMPTIAIARARAGAAPLANLIKDASFEDRGAGKWPGRRKATTPDAGFEAPLGVYVWHRTGTPVNVTLSSDEAHSGHYSVCMQECGVTAMSESITCPGTGNYHFGVWVRHNGVKGNYTFRVWPTSADGKTPATDIEIPEKPDEWQHLELDYSAPSGTKAISLMILAGGQAPGAKLWIDDYFAGKYGD